MAYSGEVVSWRSDKGFGFLKSDDLDKDLFCHHSAFGGGDLIEGRRVTFDIEDDRGGKKCAANVEGDAVDKDGGRGGGRGGGRDDDRRGGGRDRYDDRDRRGGGRDRYDSRDRRGGGRDRHDSRDRRGGGRDRYDSRDRRGGYAPFVFSTPSPSNPSLPTVNPHRDRDRY